VSKPRTAERPPAPRPTEEQVVAYLKRHPDFLATHPDLIEIMTPPARRNGDRVVDFQSAMIERLQSELGGIRANHDSLVTTTRGNLSSQARIHHAVLDLLNARSFEHFVEAITTDLAVKLDLDCASLCIESDQPNAPRPRTGVRFLPIGAVDSLLGADVAIKLRPAVAAERRIYGAGATLVKSDALLRLAISPETPTGLIALGAREPGHFQPKQGTELLSFLARVIESTARAWLDLPS
jgi:hypothetical protein